MQNHVSHSAETCFYRRQLGRDIAALLVHVSILVTSRLDYYNAVLAVFLPRHWQSGTSAESDSTYATTRLYSAQPQTTRPCIACFAGVALDTYYGEGRLQYTDYASGSQHITRPHVLVHR